MSSIWKKYSIVFWQDDEYVIYDNEDAGGDYVFKGSLVDVHAWLSLKENGYDF